MSELKTLTIHDVSCVLLTDEDGNCVIEICAQPGLELLLAENARYVAAARDQFRKVSDHLEIGGLANEDRNVHVRFRNGVGQINRHMAGPINTFSCEGAFMVHTLEEEYEQNKARFENFPTLESVGLAHVEQPIAKEEVSNSASVTIADVKESFRILDEAMVVYGD